VPGSSCERGEPELKIRARYIPSPAERKPAETFRTRIMECGRTDQPVGAGALPIFGRTTMWIEKFHPPHIGRYLNGANPAPFTHRDDRLYRLSRRFSGSTDKDWKTSG